MSNEKSDPPGVGLGQLFGREDEPDLLRTAETLKECPACKRSGICVICQGSGRLITEYLDGHYDTQPCPSCWDGSGKCTVCRGQGWCTASQASNWNLKHVASTVPRL